MEEFRFIWVFVSSNMKIKL